MSQSNQRNDPCESAVELMRHTAACMTGSLHGRVVDLIICTSMAQPELFAVTRLTQPMSQGNKARQGGAQAESKDAV